MERSGVSGRSKGEDVHRGAGEEQERKSQLSLIVTNVNLHHTTIPSLRRSDEMDRLNGCAIGLRVVSIRSRQSFKEIEILKVDVEML